MVTTLSLVSQQVLGKALQYLLPRTNGAKAIFLEVKSEFKGGVKDALRRDVLQSHSVNETRLRRMPPCKFKRSRPTQSTVNTDLRVPVCRDIKDNILSKVIYVNKVSMRFW